MTLTAEQYAARARGIGSSDAAAALGLNPYRQPIELWQEKSGQVAPFAGNEATRWGQLLEPAIRQEYAERTGRAVRLPAETLVHPVHAFMLAHPDGVTDDRRLYEGKTARYPDGWGEPGTDQIPQHYLIQVQHALFVTALPVADVAVLIGGQDFRLYEVPADPELQEMLIAGEFDFWQHVVRGEPPEVDFNATHIVDLVKKLYRGTNGQTLTASETLEDWRVIFEESIEREKNYHAAAEAAKAHLLYAMGEAALLMFADGRALRRQLVNRKGYTVQATQFVDARFVNNKECKT